MPRTHRLHWQHPMQQSPSPTGHRSLRAAALFGLALPLMACDGRQPAAPDLAQPVVLSAASVTRMTEAPSVETQTPAYPVAVLYIVGREYVLKHGLTQLDPSDKQYLKYVERRLRQLYPEKGYDGMIEVAAADWDTYRGRYARYEAQSADYRPMMMEPVCPMSMTSTCDGGGEDPGTGNPDGTTTGGTYEDDSSWTGNAEHPAPADNFIPTVQEEIDTLQAEQPEIDRVYYYESLASGSYRVGREPIYMESVGTQQPRTIDDLIRLAGEGRTPMDGGGQVHTQGLGGLLVALPVVVGVLYYYYWRIETSGERAEQRANQFFPGDQHNTRADAFRHTFLSMQLRRYMTGPIAKSITDEYEDRYSGSYAETRMDQHNNYLGRVAKYQHFRGHWFWDRWDWKEWAVRVRNYIADPARGEFIPEWAQSPPPSNDQIYQREIAVHNWKYIYLAN